LEKLIESCPQEIDLKEKERERAESIEKEIDKKEVSCFIFCNYYPRDRTLCL